jgi:hypothetical protein
MACERLLKVFRANHRHMYVAAGSSEAATLMRIAVSVNVHESFRV